MLTSEAYKTEKVNQASGEADAILAKAEAQAEAIKRVAQALESKVSLARAGIVSDYDRSRCCRAQCVWTRECSCIAMLVHSLSFFSAFRMVTML